MFLQIWSLFNGKPIGVIHPAQLDVTICDSDLSCSSVIVTLDSHKNLLHTQSVKGKEKNEITLDNIPSCCTFSLNSKKLAIGFKNGTVQVINLLFYNNCYLLQTTVLIDNLV